MEKKEVNPRKDGLVLWLLLLGALKDKEITQMLDEIAMQEDQSHKKVMVEWDCIS